MDKTSGAYQHISIGIRELSKHFTLTTILPPRQGNQFQKTSTKKQKLNRIQASGLYGAARDIRDFIRLLSQSFRVLKKIRNSNCDAVYLRVQALSPLPLILRVFRIKCFLEANGLQFKTRCERFNSWLGCLHRPFEYLVYKTATHVFFVGSYGDYWRLPSDNWSNIENGVEQEFIEQFSQLNKAIAMPINLCLIARLVGHHQIDILVNSIRTLSNKERKKIHLHLIGSGFDYLEDKLSEWIAITNHGFVERADLAPILKKMHLGIITGGSEYASHMKLFDYAAAKAAVVAPGTYHLKKLFVGKGVTFFKQGDSGSLAEVFRKFIGQPETILSEGDYLYHYIRDNHTWGRVFNLEAEIISQKL